MEVSGEVEVGLQLLGQVHTTPDAATRHLSEHGGSPRPVAIDLAAARDGSRVFTERLDT